MRPPGVDAKPRNDLVTCDWGRSVEQVRDKYVCDNCEREEVGSCELVLSCCGKEGLLLWEPEPDIKDVWWWLGWFRGALRVEVLRDTAA